MELGYLIFLLILALAAYLLRLLSIVGTITAFLIGLALLYFGGSPFFLVLLIFFAASNILTKLNSKKKKTANKISEKGLQSRDALQVFANGLFAVFIAISYFFLKNNPFYGDLAIIAFLGAISAMCADTAATEIGVLSKKKPLMITDFKPTQKGISGGVSIQGFLGSLLGGGIIGIAGILLFPHLPQIETFFAVVLGGFVGAFVDSILGALMQGVYHCPKCKTFTESEVHKCGKKCTLVKGIPFFNNDIVNFLSSIAGAIVAIIAFIAFQTL